MQYIVEAARKWYRLSFRVLDHQTAVVVDINGHSVTVKRRSGNFANGSTDNGRRHSVVGEEGFVVERCDFAVERGGVVAKVVRRVDVKSSKLTVLEKLLL